MDRPPADLDEALQCKRSGDLDGALISLEAVLAERPQHTIALCHLAEVQIRRGRTEEAGAALDRAESLAGTTAFSARVRGELLYKQERWHDAAKAYEDADALGSRGTWCLQQLARCRMRLRDLAGAAGAASRAVERDPSCAPAWVMLGDVAKGEKRPGDAERMYARAHEAAPDDGFAYTRLVESRMERIEPDRREHEVEVLLKTARPAERRHLRALLAKVRANAGDHARAADAWGETAADEGDPFSRKMHGYTLRKAGRLDEAAPILGRCLAENPLDIPLFKAYVGTQRTRGALGELREVLENALPRAGKRRGAFLGELRKLDAEAEAPKDAAGAATEDAGARDGVATRTGAGAGTRKVPAARKAAGARNAAGARKAAGARRAADAP